MLNSSVLCRCCLRRTTTSCTWPCWTSLCTWNSSSMTCATPVRTLPAHSWRALPELTAFLHRSRHCHLASLQSKHCHTGPRLVLSTCAKILIARQTNGRLVRARAACWQYSTSHVSLLTPVHDDPTTILSCQGIYMHITVITGGHHHCIVQQDQAPDSVLQQVFADHCRQCFHSVPRVCLQRHLEGVRRLSGRNAMLPMCHTPPPCTPHETRES